MIPFGNLTMRTLRVRRKIKLRNLTRQEWVRFHFGTEGTEIQRLDLWRWISSLEGEPSILVSIFSAEGSRGNHFPLQGVQGDRVSLVTVRPNAPAESLRQ